MARRGRNPVGPATFPRMTPLRTFLFDLDGTLIDSVRLILDSYHHTLATHGLPPRSDEDWLRGVGTPLRVQFADWGEHRGNARRADRDLPRVQPGPPRPDGDRVPRRGGGGRGDPRRGPPDRPGHQQEPARARFAASTLAKLETMMDVLVCADEVPTPSRIRNRSRRRSRCSAPIRERRSTWATAFTTCSRAAPRASAPRRRSGARSDGATWRARQPDYWLETPADLLTLLD